MTQVTRIIAPTDFSPAADRATHRAASLASSSGGLLYLIHVLPPADVLDALFPSPSESQAAALRNRAEHELRERAKCLADRYGTEPECRVVHGYAHQAILDASDSLGADLVALGAQGEREGVLPSQAVGDTALKVSGRSRVPVLLVEYATRAGDERTRKLLDLLRDFDLHAARARLHVERGEPLEVILKTAAFCKADLIIVGRREQPDPLVAGPLGSVARHIAFLAPVDVMIVPPQSSHRTEPGGSTSCK